MNSNRSEYQDFDFPIQEAGHVQHNKRTENDDEFDLEFNVQRVKSPNCCCCSCCLGCFGLALFIVLAVFGFWYSMFTGAVPLIVSPATTVIVGPLKADGTVDFHQALQDKIEPDIPIGENGFRAVLSGYGRAIFEVFNLHIQEPMAGPNFDWQYLEMCRALNVDPATPPTLRMTAQRDAPNFEHWLGEIGEGLDVVQTAVGKQHYFVPMVRRDENDLIMMTHPIAVYQFHEELSNALRSRARHRFEQQQFSEGWKDMLASIRLFRFVTIKEAYKDALRRGDEGKNWLLLPVASVVNTLEHWTPEQLEQAVKDLESLPDWQNWRTMLTVMQFQLLDFVSATNNLENLHRRLEGMAAIPMISFDWNHIAIELNREIEAYAQLLETAAGKSIEEQFEMLNLRLPGETSNMPLNFSSKIEDWAESLGNFMADQIEATGDLSLNPFLASGRSRLIGAFIGQRLVPWATGEMYRLQLIEEARCQALRLAIALELFKRKNGHYPESLEELGLITMEPAVQFEYERQGGEYRLENKLFR